MLDSDILKKTSADQVSLEDIRKAIDVMKQHCAIYKVAMCKSLWEKLGKPSSIEGNEVVINEIIPDGTVAVYKELSPEERIFAEFTFK